MPTVFTIIAKIMNESTAQICGKSNNLPQQRSKLNISGKGKKKKIDT